MEKVEFASIITRNYVFSPEILNSIFLNNPVKTYASCLPTFYFSDNSFFELKNDFCIYKKYQ